MVAVTRIPKTIDDEVEETRPRTVEWSVQCDAPDCDARVTVITVRSDREAIELALETAADDGWSIVPDRFIRPRLDLCPKHPKDSK